MKKLLLFVLFLAPIYAFAQPCATWVSDSTVNVLCNGDSSGAIYVNASATATPITYSISGMTTGSNTTGSFYGLLSGMYTITATDANNCSTTTVLGITEPSALAITSVTTTTPSCIPGGDGVLCLTASGGTGPYTYTTGPLTNLQTSNCFYNLSVGAYTATVTDANGCSASSQVIISTPGAPSNIIVTGFNMNPCDPDTISVIATPGSFPILNYSITPMASQPNPGTFIISSPGMYSITVTDGVGCSASTAYTLTTNGPQLTSSQTVNPSVAQPMAVSL
jgi:hypothetical protein